MPEENFQWALSGKIEADGFDIIEPLTPTLSPFGRGEGEGKNEPLPKLPVTPLWRKPFKSRQISRHGENNRDDK